jgi:multidrug transporter EmrE-like cation transporter
MKSDKHILIPIILFVVLFESIAQFHIRKGRELESQLYTLIGLVSYCVVGLLLFKCYEFEGVGMVNLIWSVLSIVSMTAIGYMFFDEEINKYDLLGIGLCLTGMYFIFIYGHG